MCPAHAHQTAHLSCKCSAPAMSKVTGRACFVKSSSSCLKQVRAPACAEEHTPRCCVTEEPSTLNCSCIHLKLSASTSCRPGHEEGDKACCVAAVALSCPSLPATPLLGCKTSGPYHSDGLLTLFLAGQNVHLLGREHQHCVCRQGWEGSRSEVLPSLTPRWNKLECSGYWLETGKVALTG